VKKFVLEKKLKSAGWIITAGSNHDLAKHPLRPGEKIPIPRHNEINEYTAKGILHAAGIE
jgi:hypothetical protein